MSFRGQTSSAFCTHITRTSTMFIKKSIQMNAVSVPALSEASLHHFEASMSPEGRISSTFYTHRIRTLAKFVKKSIKMLSSACQLSVKQVLVSFSWIFFISIIHQKINLIKWVPVSGQTSKQIYKKYFFANFLSKDFCHKL